MLNRVQLIGNVGGDPEVREVNGTKVAEFSLATSESYKPKDGGERVTKTEWSNIVAWRGLAEVIEKYVKKGSLLYIEGKKETQMWEKDGEKKYKTIIQCSELKMLGSKNSGDSNAAPAPNEPVDTKDDLPF